MTNKDRTNLIIIAAALVIIIALGWLVVARNRAPSTVLGNSDTDTSAATQLSSGADAVAIKDQPAGSSVAVASMTVTKDSWVAVKETKTGRILGAARFAPGVTAGEVPLLRATVKGEPYEAIIYTDDGDKAFDLHKDTLVVGASSPFTAQ